MTDADLVPSNFPQIIGRFFVFSRGYTFETSMSSTEWLSDFRCDARSKEKMMAGLVMSPKREKNYHRPNLEVTERAYQETGYNLNGQ